MIKFQLNNEPKYIFRNGKHFGPFIYSTEWAKVENFYEQLFYTKKEKYEQQLKKAAFNKGYVVPTNPIHLARDTIKYQEQEIIRWKKEAIEAKKQLSVLKRTK